MIDAHEVFGSNPGRLGRKASIVQGLTEWARGIMDQARNMYGVNPVVFLALFLGSGPVFYYSLFRLLRSLARKSKRGARLWSAVFLAATAAPFLYVLAFGRNLPVWVYGILALLIGQGVWSLVRRLLKNAKEVPDEREAP